MGVESMKISPVDPRYVSEEDLTPVYRVDFWNENCDSSEHRIENAACVEDVLAWAEANRNGRQAVVWVEYNYGGVIGMCRLHGQEPTGEETPLPPSPMLEP
ncbi:hypothetical protein CGQ24_10675 [Arthrobacter sp. 7749]|uniref:GNAT family N-acetyltransferase n=2 Tax=Paeniglutamicibacter terrestris TaxID=2723403 RepID=A0ABX1G791_9MICC|nr:hypothetical protein CGQ24_10675 [Arthrobacter sp. 7749]NKG21878.1 hypothetical protein [Paeniglutamicibacter terrestris]